MKTGINAMACAAMVAAMLPTAALADDPNDPTMRTAAARARDKAMIRQLNVEEAALVKERDAVYAEGWRAYAENVERVKEHERDMADFRRKQAEYEVAMAQWRHNVAACRSGTYSACDN